MQDKSFETGKREPASLPLHEIASLSGVDVLRMMIAGGLPPPPFAVTTSVWLTSADEGAVVFEGEPAASFLNPLGTVHGGWLATLLDSAMACAVHSKLGAGQTYTTLDMHVNFVKAVLPSTGKVRCEGKVIHFGSRIATSEGKVVDSNGKLLAHGTETCLIMPLPAGSRAA